MDLTDVNFAYTNSRAFHLNMLYLNPEMATEGLPSQI